MMVFVVVFLLLLILCISFQFRYYIASFAFDDNESSWYINAITIVWCFNIPLYEWLNMGFNGSQLSIFKESSFCVRFL